MALDQSYHCSAWTVLSFGHDGLIGTSNGLMSMAKINVCTQLSTRCNVGIFVQNSCNTITARVMYVYLYYLSHSYPQVIFPGRNNLGLPYCDRWLGVQVKTTYKSRGGASTSGMHMGPLTLRASQQALAVYRSTSSMYTILFDINNSYEAKAEMIKFLMLDI